MNYYINNRYEDGHVDYIATPKVLDLTPITQEEYEAAVAALEEEGE